MGRSGGKKARSDIAKTRGVVFGDRFKLEGSEKIQTSLEEKLTLIEAMQKSARQTRSLAKSRAGLKLAGLEFPDGTDLSCLNLDQEDLSQSIMKNASFFSNSDMKTPLSSSLTSASFINADLRGASFEACSATGADFSGACLKGADLRFADFSGANFAGAELNEAFLENTNLAFVKIDKNTTFTGARLSELELAQLNCDGAGFVQVDLIEVDFSGGSFVNADFSQSAIFNLNIINGAKMDGTTFQSAALSGVDAIAIEFRNSNFQDAKIDSSSFNECDFSGANMVGAVCENTSFENTSFTASTTRRWPKADISDAIFRKCNFSGSDIESAKGYEEATFFECIF